MWDDENHRLADTVAVAPQKLAEAAGFNIPADRKFIIFVNPNLIECMSNPGLPPVTPIFRLIEEIVFSMVLGATFNRSPISV